MARRCDAISSQSHGPWAGSFYSVPLGIVVLVGAVASVVALRRIVHRPRPEGTSGQIVSDDALRRRAADAVTGAGGALVSIPLIGVSLVTAAGLPSIACRPAWWTRACRVLGRPSDTIGPMRIATLRRNRRLPHLPGIIGVARVDARTKDLVTRLRPGDIAVIDHLDLDKASAEALVAAGVVGVVNAAPSTSGRFPNLGPGIVVSAGIPLLDAAGAQVLRAVEDGELVRLDGDTLFRGAEAITIGSQLTPERVEHAMAQAQDGLAVHLEAFAGNTIEHLRREREMLLEGIGVPDIRTDIEGRHVLVVVSGPDHDRDLVDLAPYLRERKPVLVGVDGGADVLLRRGHRPDLIIGDTGAVSEAALTCGAEIVVHAYRDGRAPGLMRVEESGMPYVVFATSGTSEDVALLLADDKGAELIVVTGKHASLVEYLDKGRTGMASTFLTRLRVGGKLVDAAAVAKLHRPRAAVWPLYAMVLLMLAVLVTAIVLAGGTAWDTITQGDWWDSARGWVDSVVNR